MKLDAFQLLADENIHADVVRFLRARGFDVLDVREEGLHGASDVDLLRLAASQHRAVVTHDSDFGALATLAGEPIIGIVYLRPGHIDPSFTVGTIEALLQEDLDCVAPFILVAHRRGPHVRIRLRTL